MTPAALSILMTTFKEGKERNTALGIWGAVGASGGTIGVLLGGILTDTIGWEWIFFLNVPVGLAVIALAPILLGESRVNAVKRRFDLAGALSVTTGIAVLVYAPGRGKRRRLGVGPDARPVRGLGGLAGPSSL